MPAIPANLGTVGKFALAVAALAVAAFVTVRTRGGNAEEGTLATLTAWVCTDPGCGAEFRLTRAAVIENQAASEINLVACPSCGKSVTIRAAECPRCKHFNRTLPMGKVPSRCARCGKFLNATADIADQTICNPPPEPPDGEPPPEAGTSANAPDAAAAPSNR